MSKNKAPSEESQCPKCMWYDEEYQGICPAFPDGIPDKFLNTDAVHDKVIDGQKTDNVMLMKSEFYYPEM